MRKFLSNLDPTASIAALRYLLISAGGIGIAVFIGTCHWYMYAPVAVVLVATWYILYRIEIHPQRQAAQHFFKSITSRG